MSYSIDGTDIVIKGWEEGISDDPQKGINDMRAVNIVTVPGEASVSFAQTSAVLGGCTGSVVSADTGTEIITVTVTTGAIEGYQAVVFTGASLPTGITAATTYWIDKVNTTSFRIFDNARLNGSPINITATGTGTFATIDIGEVKYFEKNTGVALDANGRAWDNQGGNTPLIYLGNSIANGTPTGNGLGWYKGYLFIFTGTTITYCAYSLSSYATITWHEKWNPATGADGTGTGVLTYDIHEALSSQDNVLYICNSNSLASLFENAGKVFLPSDTTTYSWAAIALQLPSWDTCTCLEELGKTLLVGGKFNYIYPWDRVSEGFNYPMKISDNYVFHLLTVNTNTYIFAGRRGRIYVTNGSQANLYKKVPDHILGIEPIFTWKNCCYNKNQIYFGMTVTNNAQSSSNAYAGLWAIDITTDALRVVTLQSSPTASVTAVYAYNSAVASGFGLFTAWKLGTTYGVDKATSNPYDTYVAYIETDLIPVGQFLKKRTFENIEWKTSVPLVNGEGIKISYRGNKSASYVLIGETLGTSAYTPLSDYFPVNFDQSQWAQFKIEMKSTTTTPSYCRLTEIRLR